MHSALFVHILEYVSFFFFKQKTAYELRISDWSSDVCSSDLPIFPGRREHCPWPSIPRFRYSEPKERSLGWRLFQCCFLWRRSSVRKHWHGEPMAARSEERRVGKEWVSTGRFRWSQDH